MTAALPTGLDLSANTDTTLYTNASAFMQCVNVMFTNRNTFNVTVRLALVASGSSLGNGWYLEYDPVLYGNQPLERGGITLQPGDFLVGRASAAGVNVVTQGALQ